jgi:GNAT superfamily N-acetyltransferase
VKVMQKENEFVLKEGSLSDVVRLYSSISEEFPEGEHKALDAFIRLFETGKYKLLLAFDGRGAEMGYAFLYTIPKLQMLWLDFIVVHPEHQGKGYGTLFFLKIEEFFNCYEGVFLEVEIPQDSNEKQLRRISYYERMGAVRLDMPYYLPNEFGGLQMFLYFKSFRENKHIDPEKIISVIQSAYDFIHSDIPFKNQWLDQSKDYIGWLK